MRVCRRLLALLAVADRKRRLNTVLVCFFACDSARVTSAVSVGTFSVLTCLIGFCSFAWHV